MIIAGPTNDGLTFVIVYWPIAEFHEVRADVEGSFLAALDLAPGLAERVRAGQRERALPRHGRPAELLPPAVTAPAGRWSATPATTRTRSPPRGSRDAFRDAELLAEAIDAGLRRPPAAGRRRSPTTSGSATRRREPIYELTCQFAALQPPPPEMQQLFAALRDNQEQTDRFFGTIAGTVPIPEFFAPENLGRIIGRARASAA